MAKSNSRTGDVVPAVDPHRHEMYLARLSEKLRVPLRKRKTPLVADLFAGCGGLALGFEAAGFTTVGFESDPDCCESYRSNLRSDCVQVRLDRHTDLGMKPDIIIGGPPCQPFSVGGLQVGVDDPRNGFPAFLEQVRRHDPALALFENVRGMLYRGREYLSQIEAGLWKLGYVVEKKLLNSVAFGVPQRRERLIVVAHRSNWSFPHGDGECFTAGEALGPLAAEAPESARYLTRSMDTYIAKYEKASQCVRPRDLHLNKPSRTVTCRNLFGATGDMLRLRLPDGRRRMLRLIEAKRLQSFPDDFEVAGSESSKFQQIGNAVPPLMARSIAEQVREALKAPSLRPAEIRSRQKAALLTQGNLF